MLLLPTLNRPLSLARFFDSYQRTGATSRGLVLVNSEDWLRNQGAYLRVKNQFFPANWGYQITTTNTYGEKFVEAFKPFFDGERPWPSHIGLMQDDLVCVTPQWDAILAAEIARGGSNGHHIVTCSDLLTGDRGRLSGCLYVSPALIRALEWGGIFPPQITHLFGDDVLEAICAAVPGLRVHRGDVVVEHRHITKSGAGEDETHALTYFDMSPARKIWAEFRDSGELSEAILRVQKLAARDAREGVE